MEETFEDIIRECGIFSDKRKKPQSKQSPQAATPSSGKPGRASSGARPLGDIRNSGIGKTRFAQLKRGKMRIESRCDLHGLFLEDARAKLGSFLAEARQRGLQCVLVICGKGRNSPDRPVLRPNLPAMLSACGARAFCPAQPRDGGDGAFYVCLK